MKTKLMSAILVFSLVPQLVYGAYDITVKLSSNNRPINEGRLIVKEDQVGSITKDDNFIELVALPHARGVALTIVSGVMGKDGSRSVVSNAEMVVADGKTATMTVGNLTNPSEKITLTVTPKILQDPIR